MRLIVLIFFTSWMTAAEPAVVEFSAPDAARAKQRLAGSWFMRLSEAPEWQAFQDEVLKQAPDQGSATLLELWTASEVQARLGMPVDGTDTPALDLRLRLPGRAQALVEELNGLDELPGTVARADGDWLIIATGAGLAAIPGAPAKPEADFSLHVDLPTLATHLPADLKPLGDALICGLLSFYATYDAKGTHEQGNIGLRLPFLIPCDNAVFGGLPADPLLLMAVGIDGPKLNRWLGELSATSAGMAKGLVELDDALRLIGQPASGTILDSLSGTAFVAILPSAPFPTVTVAVPGSPLLDTLIQELASKADIDLSAAATTAITLPSQGRMPITFQVRRSATHWLLSSDLQQLESIASRSGGSFDAKALSALADQRLPLALMVSDNRLIGTTILGYMPMVMAGMGKAQTPEAEQARAMMASFQRLLVIATPLLPTSLAVLSADGEGLRLDGSDSLTTFTFVGPMLAGMVVPGITLAKRRAEQVKTMANLKQLMTACIAWSFDNNAMPPDLPTLCKDQQINEAMLKDPRAPRRFTGTHFLYVRPNAEPPDRQPVIMENPAIAPGRSILVCFADCSVRTLRHDDAVEVWTHALKLAADPKAAAEGVAWEDWAEVEELLP